MLYKWVYGYRCGCIVYGCRYDYIVLEEKVSELLIYKWMSGMTEYVIQRMSVITEYVIHRISVITEYVIHRISVITEYVIQRMSVIT